MLSKSLDTLRIQRRGYSTILKSFATMDPNKLSKGDKGQNLVNGKWKYTKNYRELVDPLNKDLIMMQVPQTQEAEEVSEFINSMKNCSKTGLHNPFKNKERYLMLGEVCKNVVECFSDKDVWNFFVRCIQRSTGKSDGQCNGELKITLDFFKNFTGDRVRFLAESKQYPGDHNGQFATTYRFPYGQVGLVTPFNFPLEIPFLQAMGALFMGNKLLLKPDSRVAFPAEQMVRMLHYCGLPATDLSLMHADGPIIMQVLKKMDARQTLFTGSQKVAELLVRQLKGKIKIEDAGFDWKVLGPDVPKKQDDIDYIAWQCENDMFGASGQKCSAQSVMFMNSKWKNTDLIEKITQQAGRRNLRDMTIGPVMSWNNEQIKKHIDSLLELEGAQIVFGGKPLQNHKIPEIYGSYEPTLVYVPLKHFRSKKKFNIITKELFGPFSVVTEYKNNQLETVLNCLEALPNFLTAAAVSNDPLFLNEVLSRTVNGTTYAGYRARTTGAPQNHWFGPSGDPRGGGIGTDYAIQLVWSHHREIITDYGPCDTRLVHKGPI